MVNNYILGEIYQSLFPKMGLLLGQCFAFVFSCFHVTIDTSEENKMLPDPAYLCDLFLGLLINMELDRGMVDTDLVVTDIVDNFLEIDMANRRASKFIYKQNETIAEN